MLLLTHFLIMLTNMTSNLLSIRTCVDFKFHHFYSTVGMSQFFPRFFYQTKVWTLSTLIYPDPDCFEDLNDVTLVVINANFCPQYYYCNYQQPQDTIDKSNLPNEMCPTKPTKPDVSNQTWALVDVPYHTKLTEPD